MTAKELKNALLKEAIQGKLVPHISSEGNARDLLEEMRKEKAKLIKQGKIKKEKPLPLITEDEIPFDIPENWCWCRLGEIVDTNIGLTYSPSDVVLNGGTAVLRSNNIQNGKIDYKGLVFVNKEVPDKCLTKTGDLLICARNGSKALVGKCALIDQEGMAFGAFMAIVRSQCNPYILFFINSPVYRSRLEGVNTTTINQITQDNLRETLIPLPPLAEQKRIVAAIEQFMPLIEEYGKKESEFTELNKEIAKKLKNAILQEAVQGKLVPQIAGEGNASNLLDEIRKEKAKLIKRGKIKKENLLPEITDDEISFDIPENWCWCRFGDVFQHNTGKTQNSSVETKNGLLRKFITTSNLYWNEFDFTKVKEMLFSENELQRCTVTKGDLLICEGGEYGRSAIWKYDYEVCFQNHVHRARAIKQNTLYVEFYYYLIFLYKNIGLIEGRGVGIKSLSTENLHQVVIPLPPFAEQKHIVATIEKLLPLCEKLGE